MRISYSVGLGYVDGVYFFMLSGGMTSKSSNSDPANTATDTVGRRKADFTLTMVI